MIALILAHPHIFWLSLGGLLLAAEMLGGNGYLLWSGIAGVVTGLLVWMLPLSWEWQGALFAVLTLLAAWLWSRWLRNRVKRQKPADAQLNQRGQQLLGRRHRRHNPTYKSRIAIITPQDIRHGQEDNVYPFALRPARVSRSGICFC